MDIVKSVTDGIKSHGACRSFKGGSLEQLVEELFSPQGVEFIMKTGYPGIHEFRELQRHADLKPFGIYVDAGTVELEEARKVFLIGGTDARLDYKELANSKVCLMYGAKAYITASGFSVVRVEQDLNSFVDSRATGKAVILW